MVGCDVPSASVTEISKAYLYGSMRLIKHSPVYGGRRSPRHPARFQTQLSWFREFFPIGVALGLYPDKNFIGFGEQWTVQEYTIADVADITGDFAGTTAQYNELGYLADQLFSNPGNGDIQNAIWAVLNTGGAQNSYYTGAVNFVDSNPNYATSDVFLFQLVTSANCRMVSPSLSLDKPLQCRNPLVFFCWEQALWAWPVR